MAVAKPSIPSIEQLWREVGFSPNDQQRDAILHGDGPLYLTAGPGSGKTSVLLWRSLHLIVHRDVKPEEIYLSTFTEKAALQLKEGLRGLLSLVTRHTGQPYDLSRMYVGTVHSLCQRIVTDRRFYPNRERGKQAVLLDDLGQYFYLSRAANWSDFAEASGMGEDAIREINRLFGSPSESRHKAAVNTIALFNRLSEECVEPEHLKRRVSVNPTLGAMVDMYAAYKASLQGMPRFADFSLLQQDALRVLEAFDGAGHVFRHVIVDEYQDTNTVQERIFFQLARGYHNICVVGDDDQALYRFRGATVENFVEFEERCERRLDVTPTRIPLSINYRSRRGIVDFYTAFMDCCDWRDPGRTKRFYRVRNKGIRAHRQDSDVSVIASTPAEPEDVCAEIAALVKRLIQTKRVEDPNQIAFLYPSLKSTQVPRMIQALEAWGLKVYAPRAGRFIEVDEAMAVLGLFLRVFGPPEMDEDWGGDYGDYRKWIEKAGEFADELVARDPVLARFIEDRRAEIDTAIADCDALLDVVQRRRWREDQPYIITQMEAALLGARGLSQRAKGNLQSTAFKKMIKRRANTPAPFSLSYIIASATALDWSVLDLFYRLCAFPHFIEMFDQAERGGDEGPVCNLSLTSQYLARFMDEYVSIITARQLKDGGFARLFFMSYIYALFRLGESEHEDADDPFPRGRIPFLTIHQSKGLEFPVVVLGNPRSKTDPQRVEELLHDHLHRDGEPAREPAGEPLDKMGEFDMMRMFYVALSRAKELLVIAHYRGRGQTMNEPFKKMLNGNIVRVPDFDVMSLPGAKSNGDEALPRAYSYTGDYLFYQKCPRQYMIFRKYGFVASRAQTMMFGSLVHRTLDDLHQYLIAHKAEHPLPEAEIDKRIREFFDDNFETLKLEGGHTLPPDMKETALQQVRMYWRRLRDVAEKVTDTEVRLSLPDCSTPGKGRKFVIEGVVDIVQEGGRTVMYDLKTLEDREIRAQLDSYADQLNVYAYIWTQLRQQSLDGTAVICTRFPQSVREALREPDPQALDAALARWNPVIDIHYDARDVQRTIEHFGEVVDKIEERRFKPRKIEELKARAPGQTVPFAVHVCRNCDARFSCGSYREYVRGSNNRSKFENTLRQYLNDYGTDEERDEFRVAGLDALPTSRIGAEA